MKTVRIEYKDDLVDLLKYYKIPLTASELGCAEGAFSLSLLQKGLSQLYMVDNWSKIEGITGDGNFPQEWHDDNYQKAIEATDGYNVVPLKGLTKDMSKYVHDESLGLVYVDASHSYKDVTADLMAWYRKTVSGGIIAGSAYLNTNYQVKKAVSDFCSMIGIKQINLIPENSEEDAGFWFRKI